ncbi:hypothetical protein SDC9_44744 [bioreactor metagenome]|uniref:Translocation and assembly module TamB C-terminal domain-containing protein n=1 Tax=bioreactor metagenome TaxID=1076179 RepID=A0A644W4M4_9ZZZZ
MSKGRKKTGRVLLIIYVVVFCLPAAIFALLRTPLIQQYIADQLASYLSRELHTTVEIGRVDVTFPLDITLFDLYIEDQHHNPLLSAEELLVAPEDLTSGFSSLQFKKLLVSDARIRMVKYPGEQSTNLQFVLDYFTGGEKDTTKKEKKSSEIRVGLIELRNCSYFWQDMSKDTTAKSNINFGNLYISNINLIGQNLLQCDTLTQIDLKHLALQDRSGFTLWHLSSLISMRKHEIDAHNLRLLSNSSNLDMNFAFRYDSMSDFSDFVNKVTLDADFRNSKVGFDDIARFAPALNGMSSVVTLNGHVSGTISDLETGQMKLNIGKKSHMFFNLRLTGLPDINNTEIHFDLVNSNLNLKDIESFSLPGGKSLELASALGTINQANVSAQVDGRLDGFTANVVAKTNSGFIKADINSHGDFPNPVYSGKLVVENFDLRPIAGVESKLGEITATIDFNGHGASEKNYYVEGDAGILSLDYNNYRYTEVSVNGAVKPGSFEGRLLASDPNLSLDFDGMIDFSEKLPVFDFIAQVENINLSALHFGRNDSVSGFSGFIDINVKGNDPDNMLGRLNLSDFSYYEGSREISLNTLSLKLDQKDSLNKEIELRSDLVNGNIKGQFVFSEIENAFNSYLSNYIPSYVIPDSTDKELHNQVFDFDLTFRDVQPILDVFAPGLQISKNTIMRGNFNLEGNLMNMQVASNYLKSDSLKISSVNPVLIAQTFGKNIYITAQCDNLTYNDSLELGNLVANTVTVNDRSEFSVNWQNDNSKKAYSGDLSGNVLFRRGMPVLVQFNESDLMLNDSLFHIADKGKLEIDTGYFRIQDFVLYSAKQKLMIDGRISKDPYDVVQVSFENVLLDDFDDLTRSSGVDLDGKIDGYVLLSNLYDVPDYRADVKIEKLSVNKNFVGDARITSSWDPQRQAVYSEASIIYTGNVGQNVPLNIKGFFNPRDKENMLDLAVTFDRFNLKLVQPYLKSFSSKVEGYCDGLVSVKGNFDEPDVNGNIVFRRTSILVDYLNMYYSFADTLKINNSEFSLRDITVNDTKGNKAKGDIIAAHDHFRDFYLDINLRPERMQFLNTTAKDNDYFYGTAFASGVVKISGPFNQIAIEVVARTDPGSVLCIPITSSSQVYENDFITFVSNGSDTNVVHKDVKIRDSGVSLMFDIDVTPEAEVQIVFDPKVGDVMSGSGTGRLRMTIDRSGEFLMFGNLEIEKGDYLFTLENVINKHFLVEQGGVITWNGDPYAGKMDLTARYSIKTSLYELLSYADDPEQYKAKVPVNCLMHLSGDLLSPDISFDIDLPSSDENTKNLVQTVIGNSEEMNRQVFALLILNSFIPTEKSTFNSPISQGIGNSSMELLSNQFSNWLSQISKDFDVNFSYNQGDQVTSSQVEIALSTQILNDRIVLETNLEIGGNQLGTPDNQQASNIAGDVSVEYKISEDGKLRVKAFNRSNTVDVVANNAPYTQGVAVFYRRDFDHFRELWTRKKKDNE